MKKGLRIALTLVLAVVCMFTSCDNQTQTPPATDTVGYARFSGESVQSRDLSAGYEIQAYADLYWFYDAKKADSFGTTGAGTMIKVPGDENGKGLDGQITLSQGLWNFTLYAYAEIDGVSKPVESTLAYKGETSGVTIRGGEVTTVPVTVSPQGETGTVKFGEASFSWANSSGGSGKPVIRLTFTNRENESYVAYVTPDDNFKLSGTLLFGEDSSSAIPVGFYTCKAEAFLVSEASEITEGLTSVTDMTFSLQVIGGATTVINGVITENSFGSVSFDVVTAESDVVVFQPTAGNNSVTFNTAPTEDDSNKTTVVDFGENDLFATQNVIDITVLSQVAADKGFQVVDAETEGKAVASITLSLSSIGNDTQTPVTVFESDVTVTTYIAKGLGNVENLKLVYVSDGKEVAATETFKHGITSYNSETGELVFTTNHFSQFYVVSNQAQNYVAVNVTTDVGYSSFADAFDKAEDGDVIRLVSDVLYSGFTSADGELVSAGVGIKGKHVTLDLAGYTISVPETYSSSSGILIVKDDGGLTVEDSSATKSGTIDVSTGNPIVYSCIVVYPDEAGGETESLIINGGTFKSDAFPISGNAHLQNDSDTYIEINDGRFISEMGPALFHPQVGELKISSGYFEGCTGIEIRAGNVEITGGEFIANGKFYKPSDPAAASEGNTVDGAAVAISQHVYKPEISLKISGGSFSGTYYLYERNIVENDPSVPITLSVTGGDFSGAISVQNCIEFVSGGKFSSVSDKYIAPDYISREDEDGNDEVLFFGEAFDGGSGVESDPYEISTAEQLEQIKYQTDGELYYVLKNDITNSGTVLIDENANVHLNKAGYNITLKPVLHRFNVQGELEITGDGTVKSGGSNGVFQVHNGGKLIVDGGTYINTGSWYTILAEGDEEAAVVEIKNGVVESTEPCIQIEGNANITIENGTFTSTDNAVIFVFGGDEFTPYPYELTVNGGTFIGSSESEGYIACGINMGNSGKVTLNGGTFNITDGIGILARCGTLIANEGATFNCTGDQSGQIGDSSVQIKAGSAIVVDEYANYPGGKPSVTNNGGYQLKDVYGAVFPNAN